MSIQSVPPDAYRLAECMAGVLKSIPNTESVRVTRVYRESDTDAVLIIDYFSSDKSGHTHRYPIGLHHNLYEGKDHWFFWANQLPRFEEDTDGTVTLMKQIWESCKLDSGIVA
jgi:hypothetical protein